MRRWEDQLADEPWRAKKGDVSQERIPNSGGGGAAGTQDPEAERKLKKLTPSPQNVKHKLLQDGVAGLRVWVI